MVEKKKEIKRKSFTKDMLNYELQEHWKEGNVRVFFPCRIVYKSSNIDI